METLVEQKTRYSSEDLKEFEELITNKLEDVRGELNYIREALHKRNDRR
jgi:DnaK suppressor protein